MLYWIKTLCKKKYFGLLHLPSRRLCPTVWEPLRCVVFDLTYVTWQRIERDARLPISSISWLYNSWRAPIGLLRQHVYELFHTTVWLFHNTELGLYWRVMLNTCINPWVCGREGMHGRVYACLLLSHLYKNKLSHRAPIR